MEEILELLAEYEWIYNFKLTRFFVDRVWEKVPEQWAEVLSSMSLDEMNSLPFGTVKDTWPTSFKQFITKCVANSLSREQTLDIQTSAGVSQVVPLHPTDLGGDIQRGMSEKKLHEVCHMTSLVDHVTRQAASRLVVDVGSGLGYLGQALHQCCDHNVLGLEGRQCHTSGAEKRSTQSSKCPGLQNVTCELHQNSESKETFLAVLCDWFQALPPEGSRCSHSTGSKSFVSKKDKLPTGPGSFVSKKDNHSKLQTDTGLFRTKKGNRSKQQTDSKSIVSKKDNHSKQISDCAISNLNKNIDNKSGSISLASERDNHLKNVVDDEATSNAVEKKEDNLTTTADCVCKLQVDYYDGQDYFLRYKSEECCYKPLCASRCICKVKNISANAEHLRSIPASDNVNKDLLCCKIGASSKHSVECGDNVGSICEISGNVENVQIGHVYDKCVEGSITEEMQGKFNTTETCLVPCHFKSEEICEERLASTECIQDMQKVGGSYTDTCSNCDYKVLENVNFYGVSSLANSESPEDHEKSIDDDYSLVSSCESTQNIQLSSKLCAHKPDTLFSHKAAGTISCDENKALSTDHDKDMESRFAAGSCTCSDTKVEKAFLNKENSDKLNAKDSKQTFEEEQSADEGQALQITRESNSEETTVEESATDKQTPRETQESNSEDTTVGDKQRNDEHDLEVAESATVEQRLQEPQESNSEETSGEDKEVRKEMYQKDRIVEVNKGMGEGRCVCMVGLHCCGDLTPTMLRYFMDVDCIRGLCCVSCCYHRMAYDEAAGKFVNFPLSLHVQEVMSEVLGRYPAWSLNTYAMRLAAQETRARWKEQSREDHDFHTRNVAYRALLELCLTEGQYVLKKTARKLAHRKDHISFEQYVDTVTRHVQLSDTDPEVEARFRQGMMTLYHTYQQYFVYIEPFTALQFLLQPVLESLIHQDRQLWLRENGYHSDIIPVFNEFLSPRNLALVAVKC